MGRITDHDYTHYNTANVVYAPLGLAPEQLRAGYLWMHKEFYSFKNIWRRMPESHRQRAPYLLFNLAYRKFGGVTAFLARFGLLTWVGRIARRLAYHVEQLLHLQARRPAPFSVQSPMAQTSMKHQSLPQDHQEERRRSAVLRYDCHYQIGGL